jgi:hypothetical protein
MRGVGDAFGASQKLLEIPNLILDSWILRFVEIFEVKTIFSGDEKSGVRYLRCK